MRLSPKSTTAEDPLEPGTLVCYEQEGESRLSVIQSYDRKKSKFRLLNDRGRELDLQPPRIHRLPGKIAEVNSNKAECVEKLSSMTKKAAQASSSVNLEEIWSLLSEEGSEFANDTICELYYGRNDLEEHLALRFALVGDRIYFKRKKELFLPRKAEIVDELKRAAAAKAEKMKLLEETVTVLRRRIEGEDLDFPESSREFITLLEDLAARSAGVEPGPRKEAKQLLTRLAQVTSISLEDSLEKQARNTLISAKHFNSRTNLSLIRHRVATEFSKEILEEAEKVVATNSEIEREDLTDIPTFTIDDATTKDMDDAISVETVKGGYRIGIHISDVASLIKPGTKLDDCAKERATSVYTPDGNINMFPDVLSHAKCSLVPNETRLCVSYFFDVDRTFEITTSRIVASKIRSTRKYSYLEVDSILEQGSSPELEVAYNFASTLESRRIEMGGFRVPKRDVGVSVSEDGKVSLVDLDESAPSRSLIGEMMILANETSAHFATDNGFPLIFRGQEASADLNDIDESIPDGPAAHYAMRSKLKPSMTTFTATPHATLGLKAYAQLTSPIRRYLDLVNQRQLLSFLTTGTAVFSEEDLQTELLSTQTPLKAASLVSRESKRYWLLEYLRNRLKENNTLRGTVIRVDLRSPLVELEEVCFSSLVRTKEKLKRGDEVDLRISSVDPAEDYLRLELAK